MKSTLITRLERLEERSREDRRSTMQFGLLKQLPDDFVGERHVVVVKRELTSTPNWEQCEFEERPGPAPHGTQDDACRFYMSEDDINL
jgi:hypothetical protein